MKKNQIKRLSCVENKTHNDTTYVLSSTYIFLSNPDLHPDPAHDGAVFVNVKCGVPSVSKTVATGGETPEVKVAHNDHHHTFKLRVSPISCHTVVAA